MEPSRMSWVDRLKEPEVQMKLVELAICIFGLSFTGERIPFNKVWIRHSVILSLDVYLFILIVILLDYMVGFPTKTTYCVFLILGAILNIATSAMIFMNIEPKKQKVPGGRFECLEIGITVLILGLVMFADAIYSYIKI